MELVGEVRDWSERPGVGVQDAVLEGEEDGCFLSGVRVMPLFL